MGALRRWLKDGEGIATIGASLRKRVRVIPKVSFSFLGNDVVIRSTWSRDAVKYVTMADVTSTSQWDTQLRDKRETFAHSLDYIIERHSKGRSYVPLARYHDVLGL